MNDIKTLNGFRQKLYELIPNRRDATLDLIDALSSASYSESVTQLSLNPFFRRQYNSITKVITGFLHRAKSVNENGIIRQVSTLCQEPIGLMSDLLVNLCEMPKSRHFFYSVSIPPQICGSMRRPC